MNKYLVIFTEENFEHTEFEKDYQVTPYYTIDVVGNESRKNLDEYVGYKSIVFYNRFEGLSYVVRKLGSLVPLQKYEYGYIVFATLSVMFDDCGYEKFVKKPFNFLHLTIPHFWEYKLNITAYDSYRPQFPTVYHKMKRYNYSMMLGNPSPPRAALYFNMKQQGLLKDGLVSFNNTRGERWMNEDDIVFFDEKDREHFLPTENVPMKYGKWRFDEVTGSSADDPDFTPVILGYDIETFVKSFFGVVCESFDIDYTYGTLVCEKTFAYIANGLPFIIFGDKGVIELVRNYGYDVFDDIIDHSYDKIEDYVDRGKAVVKSIKKANELDWEKTLPKIKDRLLNNINLYRIKRDTFNFELEQMYKLDGRKREDHYLLTQFNKLDNYHRTGNITDV